MSPSTPVTTVRTKIRSSDGISFNTAGLQSQRDECECAGDSDLFNVVILAQQSVRTVRDAHGDDSHAADHHHGDVDVWEDGHDGSTDREAQSAQDVDDLYAEVKVIQVLLQ